MSRPSLNIVGGATRALGYNGQTSRLSETIIDSAINEGTTVCNFGEAIAQGATDKACKVPTASGVVLLGIVHRDPVSHVGLSDGSAGFSQYKDVPYFRMGFGNATPVEAVRKGDYVTVLTSGGAYVGLGGTTVASPGSGRQIIPGHRWEATGAANVLNEFSVLPANPTVYA